MALYDLFVQMWLEAIIHAYMLKLIFERDKIRILFE